MRRTDRTIGLAWLGGLGLALHAVPAATQYASGPSATVEVASDERRRGLSWSDGDPVLRGSVSVPVAQGLSLDGTATSLWGSDRHGGADAVIDLGPSYVHQLGGWRLSLDARYHLFPGADDQGYGEFGAGAGFLIGPASICAAPVGDRRRQSLSVLRRLLRHSRHAAHRLGTGRP